MGAFLLYAESSTLYNMETAGYSGTPLAKKLGIKEGYSILLVNEPSHYMELFSDFPDGISKLKTIEKETADFIHLFCTTAEALQHETKRLKPVLKKTGMIWVSWPKGSSKIETDLKREPVRDQLLGIGLVDTKVCAVDQDWSGLKFMYRLKDR